MLGKVAKALGPDTKKALGLMNAVVDQNPAVLMILSFFMALILDRLFGRLGEA